LKNRSLAEKKRRERKEGKREGAFTRNVIRPHGETRSVKTIITVPLLPLQQQPRPQRLNRKGQRGKIKQGGGKKKGARRIPGHLPNVLLYPFVCGRAVDWNLAAPTYLQSPTAKQAKRGKEYGKKVGGRKRGGPGGPKQKTASQSADET